MHWSIILWDFTINHNKIRFRAQSEKLLCLISLLPFTRAVNMTEPLSCIWVCVCWTRAVIWYLNRLLWGACPLTVWGHSQTKPNTHSPCTNISVSTAACFSLHFSMDICMHNGFLKEKSYIMTIKWSTFGWPASSASNKGVTDGDSLTDTHRPALWTCLWNLLLQMGTLKWTTRSTAPRNISRTNWDRRNPVGKTLPYSTALHSYQARLWFLSSFHSIPLSIHLSTSLCLSSLLFSFAGVRLMKTEARMIHQEDEEKEMKK